MARTQTEIKTIIYNTYISERTNAGLVIDNPYTWSKVNFKKVLFDVCIFCWWLIEQILDLHKTQTDINIQELKPPTLRWMRNKVKEFQYGSELVTDQDYYDNSSLTTDEVSTQKIIAQSAAVTEDGIVKIKVVKNNSGDFAKLTANEKTAFSYFVSEVLPPLPIEIISTDADKIISEYDVYYDPTKLLPDGTAIVGGNKPVEDAYKVYLQNLDFNGWFVIEKLEDALKAVPGVVTVDKKYVRCAAYTNPSLASVTVVYKPFSGFLRYYSADDLKINYKIWGQ
ncbi:MAG: hypothetical protein JSR11_03580 [Bacteroidetes bacterium]|nr:hypothetical protein [Bacteroidota bacterium]